MSYAHPSPPTIQTLRRTRWSTTLVRSAAAGPFRPCEPSLELGHALALGWSSDSDQLRCLEDGVDEVGAELVAQLGQAPSGELEVAVGRKPQAEAELGVVLEQRVGPGGPAAFGVGGPGRGGQVPAVDRRATGRVGDHRPVAEELGEELQVRRLATAGAGTGELEQRLEELGAAHRAEVHPRALGDRQGLEELDVLALGGCRRLATAPRLMALRDGSSGGTAGHASTQSAQPVQSST